MLPTITGSIRQLTVLVGLCLAQLALDLVELFGQMLVRLLVLLVLLADLDKLLLDRGDLVPAQTQNRSPGVSSAK